MKPRQRVIYCHVGAPKTGTTYLQSVLWASRRELRRQGLTLPMRRVEDHVHAAQDVRELYNEKDYSPKARGGLDRFAKSLEHVHTPRALFSMEIIGSATPEQIERFYGALEGFEIHVIITARDLARQIPSAWQQRLKRRSRSSYDRYLSAVLDDPELTYGFWRGQDIAEVAQRWSAPLSPERVHIVSVPPAGGPRGLLLERFCSVIGVDPAQIDTDIADVNPSLSAPQAELMRRVNDALGDRLKDRRGQYNLLGKNYLAQEVLAPQSGPPLKLPIRYADRVRELSSRIADDIRAGGYDVVGDLADLAPTVFGQTTGDEEFDLDATDATLVDAGVQAMATMLEHRYQDMQLISELRRQLGQPEGETWARKQRRRAAEVRQDPTLLLDRLRRSGR